MKYLKCLLIVLVLWSANCFGQEFGDYKVRGKINIQQQDNFLFLRAQVRNQELFYIDELSYNLVAIKKDEKGNLSKNNQSGEFSLKPKEEKLLSSLRINLNTNRQELRSYLFIKYKGKLIHRDTLFITPRLKAQKRNRIKESDFLIRGIVIDEARTRIGKEYHDLFYKEYIVTRRNYPFVIKITEKPALGSSSILSVEAEGRVVHQFMVQPKEEYLKSNVAQAMIKLRNFSKRRRTVMTY